MCIYCSFHKQQCRLKSTTTNGCQHFGQSEQRKSSTLFPIQSEKSPDSWFFICDPTKKCIMPSSRERPKEIIGRGQYLRLPINRSSDLPIHRSTEPQILQSTDPTIYRSTDLAIYLYIDLAIYRSINLQIHSYRSTNIQVHRSTDPVIQ